MSSIHVNTCTFLEAFASYFELLYTLSSMVTPKIKHELKLAASNVVNRCTQNHSNRLNHFDKARICTLLLLSYYPEAFSVTNLI